MIKATWFVVYVDYDNNCTVEPCVSFDDAYSKGCAKMDDGGCDGFHVTLSAGYWK